MNRIQVCGAVAGVLALGFSGAQGGTFSEDFSSDPAQRGWVAVGDTNLFHWNVAERALEVTWDSSKSNSYYAHPLGGTIGRHNDFAVEFDLRLRDFAAGVD